MKRKPFYLRDNFRLIWAGLVFCSIIFAAIFIAQTSSAESNDGELNSVSPLDDPNFPREFDIRAIHGTPRGTDTPVAGLPFQNNLQLKSIASLKFAIGLTAESDALRVEYNGLTATPRHIVNREGYLTGPSNLDKEQIARNFISKYREMFRFSEEDLNSLKLISRATTAQGTTIMLFNQRANGMTVFNGSILVNVAGNGQIVSVGGDTFPQMTVTNQVSISPEQAIQNAASGLNIHGYSPVSMGSTQVLATYGDLPHEFVTGEKFSRGTTFGDDIVVTQAVFPMLGGVGRIAYKFTLTTQQYMGVMWQHFVDAQTGEVLRRSSLTSFQKNHRKIEKEDNQLDFGPAGGGGPGQGRRGTYRPDLQDFVESFGGATGTAQGKLFDTSPVILSGKSNFGASTRIGTVPTATYTESLYAPDAGVLTNNTGRGFRIGQATGRTEFPLPFATVAPGPAPSFTHALLPGKLGQGLRGMVDAANPTVGSPFGWFYLPTDTGGAEITAGNSNRTTTRALGYTMAGEAVTRNQVNPGNSPVPGGTQPFSADLTTLTATANLADGRTLSSVYQSRYTEGNNILTADDRANDNEGTHGIKGYAVGRQYNAAYFDFIDNYHYSAVDATAAAAPTAQPDIFPGTISLFFYNNILHDYWYSIGFTEPFWNFQMDNFGKGGAGGDPVSTQVQDASGINNANMGTPDEGGMPRMQMFLFTNAAFRRSDGSFDFDVVAHEQYHGVSNRSAGKGGTGCLGIALVGESGGMGEGWSDWIAASMTDDDVAGDYVTGQYDIGIRKIPMTNYRYSYGAANNRVFPVRRADPATPVAPDPGTGTATPFQVHANGELWSSMLWDMRELLIMKQKVGMAFPGIFYDGSRRLGTGSNFYVGQRQIQSTDGFHPISYRVGFGTTAPDATTGSHLSTPTINGPQHFVRPGMVAQEIATMGHRQGPLATAVSRAGRLADQLVLRGLQICPCNPSVVEMRDSILAADREITGGENQAVIWRAFATHGAGLAARSTGGTGGTDTAGGAQSAPTVAEDFSVPADVTACEASGPLAEPSFSLANTASNTVTVTIPDVTNATSYVIARSTNAAGPFQTVATVADTPTGATYNDTNGIFLGQTYHYQVHAARNPQCVGPANTMNITITAGTLPVFSPVFFGVKTVSDTRAGNSLTLTWTPATSLNPTAAIVYDVYRVETITTTSGMADSTTAPTFTPVVANRITPAGGITGPCTPTLCTYVDTGRVLGQPYYYIVQARDTNSTPIQLDTNNTGNRVARFSAPTTNSSPSSIFAFENFEMGTANGRFTPALTDKTSPDQTQMVWQRAQNSQMTTLTTAMYAPDLDVPANDGTGLPSDFTATIGPFTTLTQASVMEFESRHNTEFAFDGGVIEVSVGGTFNANPFPDNAATFDTNYFAFENGYTGKLDGALAGGVPLSHMQGRFAFQGVRGVTTVRIALGEFAPGQVHNTGGAPVFIRFRMTSDAGTTPRGAAGWYIDNLVIKNYATAIGLEADVAPRNTGSGTVTVTDMQQIRNFQLGQDLPYQSNEFQRADCAPLATLGNGSIGSTDVVQARRYVLGLDPTQFSGGPTAPGGPVPPPSEELDRAAGRAVKIATAKGVPGQRVAVAINVDAAGDESVYGFSLNYDTSRLTDPTVRIGKSAARGGNVMANTSESGRIGFSVDFNGRTISAGKNRQLVVVEFTVPKDAPAGDAALTFSDDLAVREISDLNANAVAVNFEDGAVVISAPSDKIAWLSSGNHFLGMLLSSTRYRFRLG